MLISVLSVVCVGYNAVYFYHCIKSGQRRAAVGTAAMMLLVTAGVVLLGFAPAW